MGEAGARDEDRVGVGVRGCERVCGSGLGDGGSGRAGETTTRALDRHTHRTERVRATDDAPGPWEVLGFHSPATRGPRNRHGADVLTCYGDRQGAFAPDEPLPDFPISRRRDPVTTPGWSNGADHPTDDEPFHSEHWTMAKRTIGRRASMSFLGITAGCGIALVGSAGCESSGDSGAASSVAAAPPPNKGVYSVEIVTQTTSTLPACTSKTSGETAWIVSTATLETCVSASWVPVPCTASLGGSVAYDSATNTLWACTENPDGGAPAWMQNRHASGTDRAAGCHWGDRCHRGARGHWRHRCEGECRSNRSHRSNGAAGAARRCGRRGAHRSDGIAGRDGSHGTYGPELARVAG